VHFALAQWREVDGVAAARHLREPAQHAAHARHEEVVLREAVHRLQIQFNRGFNAVSLKFNRHFNTVLRIQ
jgi:hypothetical protein